MTKLSIDIPTPDTVVKSPDAPFRYRSSMFHTPPWQNKRRILFICHDGKPYGSQKSLELMIEHLPPEEYHCFVSFGKPGRLMDRLSKLPHVTTLRHQRIMTVKHSHRNSLQRLGDQLSLLLNTNRVFQLLETCQQFKIDLIHSNSLVSLEGAITAKILGIPHVWHIREWFEEENPRFQLTLGDAMTKKLVHHLSDRVMCVSTVVRSQFEPYVSQDPNRYVVLYNAINATNMAPEFNAINVTPQLTEAPVPLQLAYLGRVSDGKRFDDILDALIQLKSLYSGPIPFNLSVYGEFIDDKFKDYVYRQLQRHNLSEHVRFEGYHDDIAKCFSDKDLLILPSTNESFGRSVIEAMACGVPVLAARSGGPVELIQSGHHGYFYGPKDPHDLARQLYSIESRREELASLRPNAIARAQKVFDVSVQQLHLRAVYDDLLKKTLQLS